MFISDFFFGINFISVFFDGKKKHMKFAYDDRKLTKLYMP